MLLSWSTPLRKGSRDCIPAWCAGLLAGHLSTPTASVCFPHFTFLQVQAFPGFTVQTTGANDVANAFANAVGARTVTHAQACAIACIGEFIGVVALSKSVMDTVRKKMVNVDYFREDPYMLALGMACVNLGSSSWVLSATMLCMPVSTTHGWSTSVPPKVATSSDQPSCPAIHPGPRLSSSKPQVLAPCGCRDRGLSLAGRSF